MNKQTKERIGHGVMWSLLALLFALHVLMAQGPEEFPGWIPFLKIWAIGYVAAPTIIGLLYVLGTIADYGLQAAQRIRGGA